MRGRKRGTTSQRSFFPQTKARKKGRGEVVTDVVRIVCPNKKERKRGDSERVRERKGKKRKGKDKKQEKEKVTSDGQIEGSGQTKMEVEREKCFKKGLSGLSLQAGKWALRGNRGYFGNSCW